MRQRVVACVMLCVLLLAAVSGCGRVPASGPEETLALGEKYLTELEYEQAVVAFLQVIEIDPMNIRAYLGGTDAYLHLDRIEEAIQWLAGGIEATESRPLAAVVSGVEKSVIEGYLALADAYEAEGWRERALELMQRVYSETNDEMIGRKLGIVAASEIVYRENYPITWADAEMERLIRVYLDKPDGVIMYDEVKDIPKIAIWGETIAMEGASSWASFNDESFWLSDGGEGGKTGKIRTLSDLEHLTSLKDLTVNYQAALDISALADTGRIECLQRLTSLELISDNITDISVVSGLIALQSLGLQYNRITDISPISMLIELTNVRLSDNEQIASATPLKGLRKLSSVGVSHISTIDLNVLVDMPELLSLNLVGVDNVDYSILPRLDKLTYLEVSCDDAAFAYVKRIGSLTKLRLHGWGLTNVGGIEELRNLAELDLLAYECRDISPLAGMPITELELDIPKDCDLTPLTAMPNLERVVVPNGYWGAEAEVSLADKIRDILPGIEVLEDRR